MPCGVTPTESGEVGRGYGFGPGRTSSVRRLHAGIDFVAARGQKIRAAVGGTCVLVSANETPRGPLDGYGNACVIRTDIPGIGVVFWLYAHQMSLPDVRVGQDVRAGQVIGRVGNTNNGKFAGMGAHLHMECSTVAWPKAYGRGSIDPVPVFAQLGVQFEPRGDGRRARFVPGAPCDLLGELRGLRLGEDPLPTDDAYEPPPESFGEEYEVSDFERVRPLLLGAGAFLLGGLLLGSALSGMSEPKERRDGAR